jgi:hypothetical protein
MRQRAADCSRGDTLTKRTAHFCVSNRRTTFGQAVIHKAEIAKAARPRLWLPVIVFLTTLASSSQAPSPPAEIKPPDLNLILQRLEDVQHQDPAQSRPYEVTREYKVFRGYDRQPTSDVMAQINFAPPDMKTYKITQARGNSLTPLLNTVHNRSLSIKLTRELHSICVTTRPQVPVLARHRPCV